MKQWQIEDEDAYYESLDYLNTTVSFLVEEHPDLSTDDIFDIFVRDYTNVELTDRQELEILAAIANEKAVYTIKGGNCMTDREVLENIANMLRIHYPEAASVKVFVNYREVEVEISYRDKLDGISMKSLNGQWIKEESA